MASIDQKADNLKLFSFQKAIDFKSNKKYLKYLLIPITIWLIAFLSGYNSVFTGSYDRLVHHQKEFIPPAPFSFHLLNKNLKVIEGKSLSLYLETIGNTIPEEGFILVDEQKFYLKKIDQNKFFYELTDIKKSCDIQFLANNVLSEVYTIDVINVPQIQSISLNLRFPSHLNKSDEVIENTGNAIVPEGTIISWNVKTRNTNAVYISDTLKRAPFNYNENAQTFQLSRIVKNNYSYSISTSNSQLKDYEKLPFSISVIKDAYPEIQLETDIDSLKFGEAHFVGRLTDDYGLSKLLVIYYQKNNPNTKSIANIPIKNSTITDFYFVFPTNLNLKDGTDYEFYFEVFDNDKVNGLKSTKSIIYSYHKDSEVEFNEKLLEQQEENIENIDKLINKQEKTQKELDDLQKQLQNKSDIKFNETQQIQQLMKRQQQYEEMMQRQTDQLKENLNKQPESNNPLLQEKKEDIQKRIDELKQSEEQKKLLEELQKLSEKLQKEDLMDKLQKMSINNKQKEKSLEQLLELTKRFYVEQKAQQISEKLDELAKKQEELKVSEKNTPEEQLKLNEEFKKIQEDIKEMMQQNSELKQPMNLDSQKPEQESVKQEMELAKEQLQSKQKSEAQKKQQSAANKMKQMSKSFQMQMQEMQGEMIEEDIATLRRTLENLITFSYEQENLMTSLSQEQQRITNLASNLKKQNLLKTYFEHIDDSLYTLSMRQPKMSIKINEFLAKAHYYLIQTNQTLAENQLPITKSNQQFVMTAANDLAYLLSSLLDNLQNSPSMGQGSGKGKSGESFTLPDIIQKQGDIKQQMESQMKKEGEGKEDKKGEKESDKGQQKGNKNNQDGEEQSKELYEIYKQQSVLREALEKQLEDLKGIGLDKDANNAIRQMEQLEQILLEKGLTNDVLQRINRMEQDLLKLKNAAYEKGFEQKRISNTNKNEFQNTVPQHIEEFYKKLNQQELLNKEPLPFQPQINQKVIKYFNQ
jgi:hypothetical protein